MRKEAEHILRRANRLSEFLGKDLKEIIHNIQYLPDETLVEYVDSELTCISSQLDCPDHPFSSQCIALSNGAIELGTTDEGRPIRISFGPTSKHVVHMAIIGGSGAGKSTAVANIGGQRQENLNTVIIESAGTLRRIVVIRNNFETVCLRNHIRLNPFDRLPNNRVLRQEQIERVLKTFASLFQLQWGVREAIQAATNLDNLGLLNYYNLRDYLSRLQFRPGSNRSRYVESSLLALNYAISGNSPSLDCAVGHDLQNIISHGRVVFSTAALTTEQSAWRTAELLDRVAMLARCGAIKKRLLFVIDDAHGLLSNEELDLANRQLTSRHSGLHFCFCIQSVSLLPRHIFTHLSAIIVFPGIVDSRDRQLLSHSLNLLPAQEKWLAHPHTAESGEREVLCFLPSLHSTAFVLRIPHLTTDDLAFDLTCPAFIQNLPWMPIGPIPEAQVIKKGEDKLTNLLCDITTPAFEFNSMSERWARLGERSISRQRELLQELQTRGLAKTWVAITAVGRRTLLEPTAEAYRLVGKIQPAHEGKGGLLHRFLQSELLSLLRRLPGYSI